jgi:hypothetical protein
MQFVAVPAGSGYSVEAQIANDDAVGGIQIMVTPIKKAGFGVIQVNRLGERSIFFKVRLSYTVFKLLNTISKHTKIPVKQITLLYQNRRLEKGNSVPTLLSFGS